MIFVNYKTYERGTGEEALALTSLLEQVVQEEQIKIIPVVQAVDIREIARNTRLEVWTQIIDPVTYGAHTGFTLPEAVKEAGAMGTFLHHSESKFDSFEQLKQAHKRAREVNLKTLVFADDLEELEEVIVLKPDFVSYEPPDLVGNKDTSVSREHPDVIGEAVDLASEAGVPLIVGAGIKDYEDVRTSIELGAAGVAVASDIMRSQDPKAAIEEMVEGFK